MIGDWRGSICKLRDDDIKSISAATERMVFTINDGMGRASAAVERRDGARLRCSRPPPRDYPACTARNKLYEYVSQVTHPLFVLGGVDAVDAAMAGPRS